MAFKKQTQVYRKEENVLSNEEIKEFEKELEPFMLKETELFNGRKITGFELYLHNKGLFRFSPQYPSGAVVMANAEAYREARDKYSAIQSLRYGREQAELKEKERLQTLAI